MLVLRPAKAGCSGCYYERHDKCPVYKEDGTRDYSPCTDYDTQTAMIFVEQENEDEQIEK